MGLFDWLGEDPSKKAKKYLDKIPDTLKPYYDPFINAGKDQMSALGEQYAKLLGDPGAWLNQMGSSYQESPGYQFALKQALGAAGNASAAGGMAGSPAHEQQAMEVAQGLASQDYQDYMKNALGLYSQGLAGSQGMYQGGMNMSNLLAQALGQNLSDQASNAAGGAQWRNAMNLGLTGLGLTGAFGSGMFGGGGSGGGGSGGGNSANQGQMLMMLAKLFGGM